MDSKEGEVLLLKVSFVDNWQVWEFLFLLIVKKDGERVVFFVLCFGGVVLCYVIFEVDDIIEILLFENFFVELVDFLFCWFIQFNVCDRLYSYVVNNVFNVIVYCEDFEEVFNDC